MNNDYVVDINSRLVIVIVIEDFLIVVIVN